MISITQIIKITLTIVKKSRLPENPGRRLQIIYPNGYCELALYHYAADGGFSVNRYTQEVSALWQVTQFNWLLQVVHLAEVEGLHRLAKRAQYFNANVRSSGQRQVHQHRTRSWVRANGE